MAARAQCPGPPEAGFTLTEVMVTLSVLGVVTAIAVFGWSEWNQASAQRGAVAQVESVLRRAQQQAVTEGRSTCVSLREKEVTVRRGACSAPSADAHAVVEMPRGVTLVAASAGTTEVQFDLFGNSPTGGSVEVSRRGAPTTWVIEIERLTGRVQSRREE